MRPPQTDGGKKPARLRRSLLKAAAAAAILWAALGGALYWAMRQPPAFFGGVMARSPAVAMILLPFETLWRHARAGVLEVGDAAPDFRLPTLDHSQTVQLSSLRGSRAVALIFGSYT